MSISQNFPTEGPSLNLNFARSKTLDPRITFTRTSSATYMDDNGLIRVIPANSARFDHRFNPTTGEIESLGLLVEESRVNSVTDSIILSNMPDQTNVTVTDNFAVSPDGTQNASKIIETTDTGSHVLSRLNVTTLANTTYTISGYFKAAERKNVGISYRNIALWGTPTNPEAIFNLEGSGSVLSTSGDLSSVNIVNVGNGWYRCSITATRDSSGTASSGIAVGLANNSGLDIYQGITNYGLFAWGLQFEAGNFPTSFIPTFGSTATRTVDNANIIGSDVESWYRQDEGTFISDSRILKSGVKTQGVWSIGDGINQISLRSPQVTADRFSGNIGNVSTSAPGTGNILLNTFKAAVSYNSTIGRLQVGTASTEVTPSQLPINPNIFGIGSLGGGSTPLNGTIKQIVYYPFKLNNNILETFTK